MHIKELNVGRALLFQSKLTQTFLVLCCHACNVYPSPLLNNKSLYYLLVDKDPDLNELKVFGSLCYASTLQNHTIKLEPLAKSYIISWDTMHE